MRARSGSIDGLTAEPYQNEFYFNSAVADAFRAVSVVSADAGSTLFLVVRTGGAGRLASPYFSAFRLVGEESDVIARRCFRAISPTGAFGAACKAGAAGTRASIVAVFADEAGTRTVSYARRAVAGKRAGQTFPGAEIVARIAD